MINYCSNMIICENYKATRYIYKEHINIFIKYIKYYNQY